MLYRLTHRLELRNSGQLNMVDVYSISPRSTQTQNICISILYYLMLNFFLVPLRCLWLLVFAQFSFYQLFARFISQNYALKWRKQFYQDKCLECLYEWLIPHEYTELEHDHDFITRLCCFNYCLNDCDLYVDDNVVNEKLYLYLDDQLMDNWFTNASLQDMKKLTADHDTTLQRIRNPRTYWLIQAPIAYFWRLVTYVEALFIFKYSYFIALILVGVSVVPYVIIKFVWIISVPFLLAYDLIQHFEDTTLIHWSLTILYLIVSCMILQEYFKITRENYKNVNYIDYMECSDKMSDHLSRMRWKQRKALVMYIKDYFYPLIIQKQQLPTILESYFIREICEIIIEYHGTGIDIDLESYLTHTKNIETAVIVLGTKGAGKTTLCKQIDIAMRKYIAKYNIPSRANTEDIEQKLNTQSETSNPNLLQAKIYGTVFESIDFVIKNINTNDTSYNAVMTQRGMTQHLKSQIEKFLNVCDEFITDVHVLSIDQMIHRYNLNGMKEFITFLRRYIIAPDATTYSACNNVNVQNCIRHFHENISSIWRKDFIATKWDDLLFTKSSCQITQKTYTIVRKNKYRERYIIFDACIDDHMVDNLYHS